MSTVTRLYIDPVEAAGVTSRAAVTRVRLTPESSPKGENAFDGAVATLLVWAASTDAGVASTVLARGQAVVSRASAGLSQLAAMNAENATQLGVL